MKELKKIILGILALLGATPLAVGFWIWAVTSILPLFGVHWLDSLSRFGLPLFMAGLPIAVVVGLTISAVGEV